MEKSNPIQAKLFESRQVIICEQIEQKMAKRVCSELLALAASSDDDILLFVNSQGGHVESGDSIHDIIKFIKPRVIVIGTGFVASAGTHIYLAVDKKDRYCLPNTRFLIHQPSGGVSGQASDIRIQAEQIVIMRKRLAHVIADATGQPFERVMEDIDRDNWTSAEQAIEYGLCNKIITNVNELT